MPSEHGVGIRVVIDQGTSNVNAQASTSTSQKRGNVKTKKGPRDRKAIQSVSDIDTHFRKRQLEMLEEEHKYNVKVAKLKIKKLELEISLLEKKN